MLYSQDISKAVKNSECGSPIDHNLFAENLNKVKTAKANINEYQNNMVKDIFDSARKYDLGKLKDTAGKIQKDFKNILILGTGGSILNPKTILALSPVKTECKIYCIDNIDPSYIDNLFSNIDLNDTAFLVISKSGGTTETIAQMIYSINRLQQNSIEQIGRHFFVITEPRPSIISNISNQIGATIFDHDKAIGGRFSTFTNVALLPALIANLDAELFLKGGQNTLDVFFSQDNTAPEEGAAIALQAMQSNININIYMPYSQALMPFTAWISQIWAESLGKDGYGSTPLQAIGTLDQHSQLQLYLDGPKDKFFTLFDVQSQQSQIKLSNIANIDKIDYIEGRTLEQINAASLSGTIEALSAKNCPLRLFKIDKLNEESLGGLMMHFIIETVLTAQVMGINAFDQPAVEDGKQYTRKILCG